MTADTVTAIDQLDLLRAALRAKLAASKVAAGRAQALEDALDRARDAQRNIRAQLADAENSLRDARRDARSVRAYAFLNDDDDGLDLLDTNETEVTRLQAEIEKYEDIENAIGDEIANVQAGLRDLRTKCQMAVSDLIIASPEYQHLLEQHAAAFKLLRSIKVAMRLVAGSLYGPPSIRLLETAEIWQPMEVRVDYPVDETPEAWRSALEDLSTNADALLPHSDAAAPNHNGHLTRPGRTNGNGHPVPLK